MRLIDADELIETIEGSEELLDLQKYELIDCVDACDTAYDVDKVVEQLKKELKQANEDKERYIHGNPLEFDMANRAIGYAVGINYAIEIVRKGGVSDETGI